MNAVIDTRTVPAARRLGAFLLLLLMNAPVWAQDVGSMPASVVRCEDAVSTESRMMTLEEAVVSALANNPAVREAEARERSSMAGAQGAGSPLRPQASLETRRSWVSDMGEVSLKLPIPLLPPMPSIRLGNQDLWATVVTLRQIISSGGKFEALRGQAVDLAQANRQMSKRIRQVVGFEAERAFLLLLNAQHEEDVASSALSTAEKYVQVAEARFKERTAARFDVLRAEVQREEARQDLVRARSGIESAQAALGAALGLPAGHDPRPIRAAETTDRSAVGAEPLVGSASAAPLSSAGIGLPPLAEALAMAFKDRPELAASVFQMSAAQRGIAAARAERRPQISVAADYQHVQPESPATVSRWSTMVVAGVPLLDGGQVRARVRQASAQRDQVAASRETLETTIEREIRQAHARATAAATQVGVARNRVELAEEMLRVIHVRAESGVSTATEVADAQTSLTRARQGLIRSESDLLIARAELRLAMGHE